MVDVDPGCAVAACISTADGAGGANPVGEGEAEAEGEGKIQDDEAEAEMGGCGEGGEGDGVPPNSDGSMVDASDGDLASKSPHGASGGGQSH
jgi:hypothetical protein